TRVIERWLQACVITGTAISRGHADLRWPIGSATSCLLPTAFPPVVVGHSMGGLVVQKYLENHTAPAGVLLASMPVDGASRGLVRIMSRHPLRSARASLTGKSLRAVNTPQAVRENFYS